MSVERGDSEYRARRVVGTDSRRSALTWWVSATPSEAQAWGWTSWFSPASAHCVAPAVASRGNEAAPRQLIHQAQQGCTFAGQAMLLLVVFLTLFLIKSHDGWDQKCQVRTVAVDCLQAMVSR